LTLTLEKEEATMTMFIRTEEDGSHSQINTSEIVKVWDETDEIGAITAVTGKLRDGKKVQFGMSAEIIADMCCPMLPAQPGFELLRAKHTDDEETFYCLRQPIIGWRIDPYQERGSVRPVVLEHITCEPGLNRVIKCPDGRLIDPWAFHDSDPCYYDDKASWLAKMKAGHEKLKAWKKKQEKDREAA
jgi:hypothetical protein